MIKTLCGRKIIRLCYLKSSDTIEFACSELQRYLRSIGGETVVKVKSDSYIEAEDTIFIGVFSDFEGQNFLKAEVVELDDVISINVCYGSGIIAGANERAVLIAVYRYLTALGCRFTRPGAMGEHIPSIEDPTGIKVNIQEIPSFRHRGLCSEGACSHEHILSMVDWMPKVGMNSYFIEYLSGYIYYNNWYAQKHKPGTTEKMMELARTQEFVKELITELKKRGMLYHNVGHGWTSIPLGIPEEVWDDEINWDFGEKTEYIRETNGERKLFKGIPRRTNLCYSKKEVRELIANAVADHCENHPEVDFLHFWLADGARHFCECKDCKDTRPSDFFVMMLNETDELLSKRGIKTRVVFIVYLDLLWAPEKEKIKNEDRFVMMFAPLHRSYMEVFDPTKADEPVEPFVLNEVRPALYSQNLNHLSEWKKHFNGDVIIFDYRFMWDQYNDPGYMRLAKVTSEDIEAMDLLGINGFIGDQTQRVFMPTGLPMLVNIRKLWDVNLKYDDIVNDYFISDFGEDAKACRKYLESISALFDPEWFGIWMQDPSSIQYPKESDIDRIMKIKGVVADFEPVIDKNIIKNEASIKRSWEYLKFHSRICIYLSELLISKAGNDAAGLNNRFEQLKQMLREEECGIHEVFDVFLFLRNLTRKLGVQNIDAFKVG